MTLRQASATSVPSRTLACKRRGGQQTTHPGPQIRAAKNLSASLFLQEMLCNRSCVCNRSCARGSTASRASRLRIVHTVMSGCRGDRGSRCTLPLPENTNGKLCENTYVFTRRGRIAERGALVPLSSHHLSISSVISRSISAARAPCKHGRTRPPMR